MKKKLISVIIPVYNSSKTLKRCIESIINQTYMELEIILINDGSNDNSLEICKKYQEKDSRIIVIDKKNGGVSSARNAGLEIANGDYISFVDSDDYLEQNMYATIMNKFLTCICDIVVFNIFFESENGNIIYDFNHKNFEFNKRDFPTYSYYNKSISGYICNKIYSRKLIYTKNKTITFDCKISISEDYLFAYEVFDNSKDIKYLYINDKLYHYVLNDSSATNISFNYSKLSYFDALQKEIDILERNNINNSFLKADYVINSVRYNIFMKNNKIQSNEKFINIYKLAKKYKKEINYLSLGTVLLVKLILANYFPFLYKIKLRNKNI